MARPPKMWWRKTHNCYYTTNKGEKKRLDPDEDKARKMFGALLAENAPSPDGKVTDLLEAFARWCQANRKPATFDWYKYALESFGRTLPPGLLVKDVKVFHLSRWIDETWPAQVAEGKPATDNTRHDMASCILRVFNWAVDEQLLTHSPLASFKKAPKTPRDTYLMPEEWDVLLAKIKDTEFLDFLWVVRLTGCRPLEARAVEARHVYAAQRCWILPKGLSKGEREERHVLLDDAALAICQRWAEKFPEGPIFRNTKDMPWTKDAINSRFQRLKVKLPFHCSAYTMRHTFATDALEAGVGEATVAALLGHKDKTQVLKTYQHVAKRADHLREGLKKATDGLKPE